MMPAIIGHHGAGPTRDNEQESMSASERPAMNKTERDQILSSMDGNERQDLRRIMREIQVEFRESRGAKSRQDVVESRRNGYSEALQKRMDAIMRRDQMGPREGEIPPDLNLKRMGSEERVRLSSFRGKRPVALVFSSYT
jgi:hypothetical protein